MKVKLRDIVVSFGNPELGISGSIHKLTNNKNLRMAAKFKITGLMEQTMKQFERFTKCRIELLATYAIHDEKSDEIKLDDNGNVAFETKVKREEFHGEIEKLLDEEIEITGEKLVKKDLVSMEKDVVGKSILDEFVPADLLNLAYLIDAESFDERDPEPEEKAEAAAAGENKTE